MKKEDFVTIHDGDTELVVAKKGAQPVSLSVGGLQILYQGAREAMLGGDPRWGKSAPNLFPNPGPVGKDNPRWGELRSKKVAREDGSEESVNEYIINGGIYAAGQHGFIKDAEFEELGVRDDYCVLTTHASSKTADYYPYDFNYTTIYDVKRGGEFNYQTVATNMDQVPIPAGMGWHPAFVLHGDPRAYKVVFKNLDCTDDCPLVEVDERGRKRAKEFSAEEVINSPKAMAFPGVKSVDVVIVFTDKNGNQVPYLSMHSEEPYLLLWSRKDDRGEPEFIAIEPWNQKSRAFSQMTTTDKLAGVEGLSVIEPHEEKSLKVKLSINPEYVKLFENSAEHEPQN